MTIVQMPDGTQVNFPDTMSETSIRGLIAQKFPKEMGAAGAAKPMSERDTTGHYAFDGKGIPGYNPETGNVAPSIGEDVLKAAPSSLARGTADLIGLPGTISDALNAGGDWAMKHGYQAVTGSAPEPGTFFGGSKTGQPIKNPISGSTLRGGLSSLTGGATDYEPQTVPGQYVRTAGEFLPSAVAFGGLNPANLIRSGLAPAVSSETAGQLAHKYAPSLEPYARFAGTLLGGLMGAKVGSPASAPKLPSAQDIKTSAGYGDQMTATLRGASTSLATYKGILANLWSDVKQAGTSYDVQQNFGKTFQNELKLAQQEGPSLHSLERLRRAVRSAGGGKLDTPNNAIANRLIDKLDNEVENLSASSIAATGAQGKPVLDVLQDARAVYRTGKKADLVEAAVAEAQNSASGVENGLRGSFRKLLKPEAAKNFSPEERLAIQRVVKGDFSSNTLRFLGTFGFPVDQGRNWLGALAGSSAAGGYAGSMFGPGIGTAIGAGTALAGTAAKYAASKATQGLADTAEALVKSGPGGKAIQAALQARQIASREAQLRAILQASQSMGQPQAVPSRPR